jgi:hypothetical protein
MKYFITFITLTFLNSLSIKAQETTQRRPDKYVSTGPRYGVRGGLNLSDLYVSDAKQADFRIGFNLGLFAKLPVFKMVSLQPELNFTNKGADVVYTNTFVNGTARYKLDYIELPVMLVVNVSQFFNVQAGVYGAALVNSNTRNKASGDKFNFADNIESADYNKLDAGIALGGGIDMGAIGIGIRYSLGFTKIGKDKTYMGSTYRFPDGTNGVINFYASLSLN